MIKIKITTPDDWQIERQIPHYGDTWNNYKFFINNNDKKNYDWWVVYEGLQKPEKAYCSQKNTILITGEPPNIKIYKKKFLEQFNYIITCHPNIKHQNKILTQQALPWMVGKKFNLKNKTWLKNFKSYDDLNKIYNTKKTKIISIIFSNKKNTPGHKQRIKFIKKLKKELGNKLDIFGIGWEGISDKLNGIKPYKYHIVLENSSCPHYWTEKLSDAFLGESFPIYYGCPNIHDYFSKKSLQIINIYKIKESINIIKKNINENIYEKSTEEIIKSKKMVLNEYNVFPTIINFINKRKQNSSKKLIKIDPENYTII